MHCYSICEGHFIKLPSIKKSLQQNMNMPSPSGYGWSVDGHAINIVWMTKEPVPKDLLEINQCRCKSGCVSRHCSCVKSIVKCSQLCACENCKSCQEILECTDMGEDDMVMKMMIFDMNVYMYV